MKIILGDWIRKIKLKVTEKELEKCEQDKK